MFFIIAIPLGYFIISFILTAITVNKSANTAACNNTIYLSTNGVHLDIILHRKDMDPKLLKNLYSNATDNYFSFGWGDENFYINTPRWADLTFNNAFRAIFMESTTLMHVTRYGRTKAYWVEVKLDSSELSKINQYILGSFQLDSNGNSMILKNISHSVNDNFYKAHGSYSFYNTCNTWANTAFKQSGLKSCYWTPFDYGLMNIYK